MFAAWENGVGPCMDQIRADMISRAEKSPAFAELPPCRHRGTDPLEMVECELCGGNRELRPVFGCAIFGKCTSRRYGTRTQAMRAMASCLQCPSYEPSEEEALGGAGQRSTGPPATAMQEHQPDRTTGLVAQHNQIHLFVRIVDPTRPGSPRETSPGESAETAIGARSAFQLGAESISRP
jgi:hypothetical protein